MSLHHTNFHDKSPRLPNIYIYDICILCFGFPCRRVLVTGGGSTRKRENAKIQKVVLPLDARENTKIRKFEK
jgi:hypothetical protein